ncbi:MAG TPA: DUF805 domain-containing protein [Rhizomicrobium sp.]|jgi:uncharacterized membrane protein YhaH (DUF805 family)
MDFNKLWQNFMDTLQNHYMDFAGRMGRTQFWYFILVCVGVSIIAAIIDGITGTRLIGAVVGLALLLPIAGMAARRMQDTGRSGQIVWVWAVVALVYNVIALLIALSGPFGALAFLYFFFTIGWLINLAMLIVTIVIIYFCAQPGQAGDNAYGPPPPIFNPGPAAA